VPHDSVSLIVSGTFPTAPIVVPPDLNAVSYGCALASFGTLAVALASAWRRRVSGSGLTVAVTASAVWAALRMSGTPDALDLGVMAGELLMTLLWILFVVRVIAPGAAPKLRGALLAAPVTVVAVTLAATLALGPLLGHVADAATATQVLLIGALVLTALGFVAIDQAARNTKVTRTWAVKFIWLAIGALLAYDFMLYFVAYLSATVPATLWAARGLTFSLIAPLIAVGVARTEHLERGFVISQRLVLYTASASITGLCLFVVVLLAEILRVRGGTWGEVLSVFVAFSVLLALVAAFLSGSARARLRVLVAKHLLPYKYDYRTAWLDLTERMTREGDGSSLAQRITDAFKRLAHVRDGGIWVRQDEEFVLRSGPGLDGAPASEPCDSEFCRFLEGHDWIVDLDLARARSGRDADVPVPQWLLDARSAWLAIPLRQKERLVAFVVLSRPLAPGPLTWEDLDLLRTAARQAASYVALEQAGEALSRERQFAAMHRFTAFLIHDLSNVVAQQRLLVDNAATHKSNPRFIEDAIRTISETARRMSRLLDQVKAGVATASPERTCVAEACRQVVQRLSDREPRPTLEVRDAAAAAFVAADRFAQVLEHLVRNAQDATPATGAVTVRVYSEGPAVSVAVVDTGRGMDQEFVRERLFRPFDTTKGAAGMGLGAYEAREFARLAGGELQVTSAPGNGTALVLRLPRLQSSG